jgi:hypothetical protein
MIVTVAASSDRLGYFAATSSDGRTIVERSRTPLCDAARSLLTSGNSTWPLVMRQAGSSFDALMSTIGHAASLTVHETRWGPKFRALGTSPARPYSDFAEHLLGEVAATPVATVYGDPIPVALITSRLRARMTSSANRAAANTPAALYTAATQ